MSTAALSAIVLSNHGFAEKLLLPDSNHQLLVSTKTFEAGTIICNFSAAQLHSHPSRYTVQTGETSHIILQPEFLQYINHSCEPNVFFNTSTMQLEALKAIAPGDEFTFFYPSTEWFMAEPFQCLCVTPSCIGTIKGAKELSTDLLNHYRLSDFIQHKLKEIKT